METKKVILAGGSGFIGQSLRRALLARGYQPLVLTRTPKGAHDVFWDGRTMGPWTQELEGAYAIVNLAGRTVNCRHTPQNREQILESRVRSVEILGAALGNLRRPPVAWVQAGSLALFGDRGAEPLAESASAGQGFPADVCRRWEQAFDTQNIAQTRKVFLRISFVFARDGGALPVLARLSRQFVGRVGSGEQFVSWVHVEDMNRMLLWAIERESARGTYNATSPHAVTNAELMATLQAVQGRRFAVPLPAWAVRVGSLFLRTEPDLILGGRRGVPARLLAEGFRFQFPDLPAALGDLFGAASQA